MKKATKKPKVRTVDGWQGQQIAQGDLVWLWNTREDPWPKSTAYYVIWVGDGTSLGGDIQAMVNRNRGGSKQDKGFTTAGWYAKKLTEEEARAEEERRLDNLAKDQHERIMANFRSQRAKTSTR